MNSDEAEKTPLCKHASGNVDIRLPYSARPNHIDFNAIAFLQRSLRLNYGVSPLREGRMRSGACA